MNQQALLVLLLASGVRAALPRLTTTADTTSTTSKSSTTTGKTSTKTSNSSDSSGTTSSRTTSSSSSSTSTSYTFTAEVPSESSPFIQTDSDATGTLFIIVGVIILSGFLLFMLWRAIAHFRSWRAAKQTVKFEKMYQFGNTSAFSDNDSMLAYDSSVFHQKGIFNNSNISYMDGESTIGLDHRSVYSFQSNFDDTTSSQGRTLKNALTNNSALLNQVPSRSRISYISPVNELIKQQMMNLNPPPMSAGSDSSFNITTPSSASTPRALERHDVLGGPNFSLDSEKNWSNSYHTPEQGSGTPKGNKHKRPPSVVLDELLNDKFDFDEKNI
ncbi:unnamed protein product [Kuraishia capsulata CBS 1993]|uniref:Uncharacterized protein n=1 Tax=Kuraishia capsulata CBS 1993 TaxID=1382522 RepID=W6MME2_9ASCO|nr:uncharacterized protein KUCA_T00002048001 [Kuraishia capsulata CBS 1993]CDK26077.1 unnamed protein product [Kuraishia capsulata CBS 1993]